MYFARRLRRVGRFFAKLIVEGDVPWGNLIMGDTDAIDEEVGPFGDFIEIRPARIGAVREFNGLNRPGGGRCVSSANGTIHDTAAIDNAPNNHHMPKDGAPVAEFKSIVRELRNTDRREVSKN